MTAKVDQAQGTSHVKESEFVSTQFEQALETFRAQISLLIQIVTVLVIADATVVGYAISTQISGILLIGSLFPLMSIYVMHLMFRFTLPVLYTAVNIERKYGELESHWLVSTLLSTFVSVEYVARLKDIGSIQEPIERIRQLRQVHSPHFGSRRKITRIILIFIAVGQAIAPLILSLFFNWRFF